VAARRFHFVVNPVSGRRQAPTIAGALARRLEAAGHATTTHLTTAPGDARAHVASLAPGAFDVLVVAGGDGTLREVVNSRPPPLPWSVAMLPAGTANLVSREAVFPLTRDVETLAASLLAATPWAVDLLEIRREGAAPEWAVATIGVGLDAEVVHRVAAVRARETVGGGGGYQHWIGPILSTLREFPVPEVEVSVDGARPVRGTAAIVQNSKAYGGFLRLVPDATLDSRRLSVVVLSPRRRRDLFSIASSLLVGRVLRRRGVRLLRGREARIRADRPTPVAVDGDAAGRTDLDVRLVPEGLTLLRRRPGT
jgi:diacylglycerol kinase (ATP)